MARLFGVVLLLLALAAPAHAASILAWDVPTLTERSTYVVEATVLEVRSERHGGDIRTVNTLRVDVAYKGAPASTLTVVQGSGRVDDVVKTIHGDMRLEAGERYVLFLAEREGELHSTLLGWSVFAVEGEGDEALLTRNLAGVSLLTRTEDGRIVRATELDVAVATPRTLGGLQREVAATVEASR